MGRIGRNAGDVSLRPLVSLPMGASDDLRTLQALLEEGSVQRAYRGLLACMDDLRARFQGKMGADAVGGVYQGRMDFTFFALFAPGLKERGLKILILFNYEAFRFEAWLAGRNRKIQREHWGLIRHGEWPGYRLRKPGPGIDSIIERDLAPGEALARPKALTTKIEKGVAAMIGDVESFLAGN